MSTTIFAFSCSACGRVMICASAQSRADEIATHSLLHASATFTLAVGVDPG